MLVERIYDEDLAQASYFIGCQAHNSAIVVDPRRDIEVYLEMAAKNGMEIVAVTETHIHADYLSGTRELAAATNATMYVSGEGGQDWQYEFDAERLMDGSEIRLGNLVLTAVHTPGHTPEHLSFLLKDGAFADAPGFMLTGDFVFAGDLGRPDLLDEAAGGVDTRFAGARQMFRSLKEKFLTLPDYVQILPGHGSGSACGKALGSVPSTTLGYERQFAWWGKYLAADDEQGFIDELLSGQPDAPAYFGRMKRQNRQGPAIMGPREPLPQVDAASLREQVAERSVIVVDTRSADEVHRGTVEGAVNIPAGNAVAKFGSWAVDPEKDSRPLIVLAPSQEAAKAFWDHSVRVGIDNVAGFMTSFDGLDLVAPATIEPTELDGFDYDLLLDVRNRSEFEDGHIPGAFHINGAKVLWNLEKLPKDGKIVSYCKSGTRSSIAASALRSAGFDVVELKGSYDSWVTR
ncbi:hypothetical protein CDES_00235 [Corynebacterium deserti GIMN1.010]|uniref:Rhodanese domain-containing protein n=1 Tax=Corynebacterium deserti GIMN1.010 TaxID=931089 RepID=A0A0M3Q8W0_9CORY|nr:MBL fold metallo-hydrolase [Corynebacterium deserti]ALC04533.1 hypothetical protein CDES_00235 [Corynebacterium deserti GIMN1.010]